MLGLRPPWTQNILPGGGDWKEVGAGEEKKESRKAGVGEREVGESHHR